MEYKYTLNDIQEKVNVSLTSLYALKSKNKEFIKNNSIRRQRIVYYNDAVMDFYLSYYKPEQASAEVEKSLDAEAQDAEASNSPLESPSASKTQESQIEELNAQIDALKAQINALQTKLDATEKERKELFSQNGAILLMLQQEKQEKMLLLPKPRQTIGEKLKKLFTNDKGQTQKV